LIVLFLELFSEVLEVTFSGLEGFGWCHFKI
jgi:hypothetical protein